MVRTRWKVCHSLLQPRGLSSRPTLHALTVITKFGEDLAYVMLRVLRMKEF